MVNKKSITEADMNYGYYSKVLNKPFDTVKELKEAEAAHYAELKAKEAKVTEKKDDAHKVEEAFKALNQARKTYKETLVKLTAVYQEDLNNLKRTFEADRARIHTVLVDAENAYANALKEFTEKYPEGYHLTLKDGDFETTLSSSFYNNNKTAKSAEETSHLMELLDTLFRF
jgi:chromosome segregation ATPase